MVILGTQLLLFHPVVDRCGPERSFVLGLALTVALTLPFPEPRGEETFEAPEPESFAAAMTVE